MSHTTLTKALNNKSWAAIEMFLSTRLELIKTDTSPDKIDIFWQDFLKDVDPNSVIPDGRYKGMVPLIVAARKQQKKIFLLLLDNKADIYKFLLLMNTYLDVTQFYNFIAKNFNSFASHKDSIAQMITFACAGRLPLTKPRRISRVRSLAREITVYKRDSLGKLYQATEIVVYDHDIKRMTNFLWDLRRKYFLLFGTNAAFSSNNWLNMLPVAISEKIALIAMHSEINSKNWRTYRIHCHARADLFMQELFMFFLSYSKDPVKYDYLSLYLFAGIIAQLRNNTNLIDTPTKIKMLNDSMIFNKDEYKYNFLPVFQEVMTSGKPGGNSKLENDKAKTQTVDEEKFKYGSKYLKFNHNARKQIYANAANLQLAAGESKNNLSRNHYRRIFSAYLG